MHTKDCPSPLIQLSFLGKTNKVTLISIKQRKRRDTQEIMVTRKQMCSLSHILLYAAGLALVFGGTYLIFLQKELTYKVVISCVIVFGLLAVLVVTLFWSNYLMKRQLYKTIRQQHIQVYAIAR